MTDNIEMAVVPNKHNQVVCEASIARKLLKDGYRIIDIKPKKNRERETAFVFAIEGSFMDRLELYIQERKERFNKKEDK